MIDKYSSIENLRPRVHEKNGKIILTELNSEDVGRLARINWLAHEKLDGTNIRFWVEDGKTYIGGRTDNAQIPMGIVNYMSERGDHIAKELPEGMVCYGEGVGPKIQGGGKYGEARVVMFDARTDNGRWCSPDTVLDLAKHLGLESAPLVQVGSLALCESRVREGLKSQYGDFIAEGLVCRPVGGFLDAYGKRIIVKIKARDYQ